MGDVATIIIRPMEALYGQFDTDDADMVLDTYITALCEFSDDTLKAAYTEVIRTFIPSRRVPCPVPAFFVQAARKSLSNTGGQASQETRAKWLEPSVEDLKAADSYLIESSSSLIPMALRQGWGRSLRDVARDAIRKFREANGRRPSARELLGLRLPPDDVEYYRKHGQQLPNIELDRILSERAKLGHQPVNSEVTQ